MGRCLCLLWSGGGSVCVLGGGGGGGEVRRGGGGGGGRCSYGSKLPFCVESRARCVYCF